jgi:hypothetical protein
VGSSATARQTAAGSGIVAVIGLVVLLSPLHLLGALIFVAAIAVLSLTRPMWGIWLVLLLFEVHPLLTRVATVNFGVQGTALILASAWKEVALACILLVSALYLVRRFREGWRPPLRPSVLDLMAVGLVGLMLGGLAGRHDGLAINAARLYLYPVAVYVALRMRPVDTGTYFRAATMLAGGIAIFGIVQSMFFGWNWVSSYWGIPSQPYPYTFWALHLDGPRAAGTFASPNELGFALIAFALMSAALIVTRPDRSRWIVIPLVATLVGLAMTFSRSAVGGAALGLTVMAGWGLWRVTSDRRRASVLLTAVIVPALAFSGMAYVSRGGVGLISSTFSSLGLPHFDLGGGGGTPNGGTTGAVKVPDPNIDPSTVDHLISLSDGWALVQANPLGVGLGTVGSRVVPGTNEQPQMVFESWYLTMGVMLGWPGLIWCALFPLALLIAAIQALRRKRELAGLVLLGMSVSVATVSFLLPTMAQPQLAMLPWAVGALALAGTQGWGSAAAEPVTKLAG